MDRAAQQHSGRIGGLTGWAETSRRGLRGERMAHVRNNSPASDEYWAKKLGFDFAQLTPGQRAEIKTEKKLYFATLRTASVRAIKRQKADRLEAQAKRLRAQADAIEAEVEAGGAP